MTQKGVFLNSVPEIDLTSCLTQPQNQPPLKEQSLVARQLVDACTTSGVFYARWTDKDFWEKLYPDMVASQKELFALSKEEKQKLHPYQDPRTDCGFLSYNPPRQNRECFKIRKEPHRHWQGTPSEFETLATNFWNYATAISDVILKLLSACDKSITQDFFLQCHKKRDLYTLAFNNYCEQDEKPGIGEHTDIGTLTLIWRERGQGLEANVNNKWISVHAKPETCVVNVGDLLMRWTGGYFKSPLHRASALTEGERTSMVLFCGPDSATEVATLPPFQRDNLVCYESVVSREFYANRLNYSHGPKLG